jgi:hypothetical protein
MCYNGATTYKLVGVIFRFRKLRDMVKCCLFNLILYFDTRGYAIHVVMIYRKTISIWSLFDKLSQKIMNR